MLLCREIVETNENEAMKDEVAGPSADDESLADLPKDRGWSWVCLVGKLKTNTGCLVAR